MIRLRIGRRVRVEWLFRLSKLLSSCFGESIGVLYRCTT